MPKARETLVSLEATPYYHCVSRCVRRTFLCGEDNTTGQSYEHRRQWIEDKILELGQIFAIDVCAYAVMHLCPLGYNHYHVLLHVDKDKADVWTDTEVIQQWHQLFNGHLLSHRHLRGDSLLAAEQAVLTELIGEWRERLRSISWFMRVLNEGVAREANKEDNCTGRFWPLSASCLRGTCASLHIGRRFSSQAILDEKAFAACMAYIDLNPVRARISDTPEASDHTSIQIRIQQAQSSHAPNQICQQAKPLMPFAGYPRKNQSKGLPFRLTDYIELVDWTGRQLREDKKGHIPNHIPPALTRLGMDAENWLYLSQHFESPFKSLVGSAISIRQACKELGKQWVHGIQQCERLFAVPDG